MSNDRVLYLYPNESVKLMHDRISFAIHRNWDLVEEHGRCFDYILHTWEYLWVHWQKEPDWTSTHFRREIRLSLERSMKETTKIFFGSKSSPDEQKEGETVENIGMNGERVFTVAVGPVGVPPKSKVDLESCNSAYTKAWQSSTSFEQEFRETNPNATDEEVNHAVAHRIAARQEELETQMAANQLEYVMNWRVEEERLKVFSDAIKTSIKKRDREYRQVVEGREPRVRKEKTESKREAIANTPEGRIAAMATLLMKTGYSKEKAYDRARMVEAITAPEGEKLLDKKEEK